MFDQLFTCRESVARHQLAPLLEARVPFLSLLGGKAREPPFNSTHDGNPFAASRCRHQRDPRLAWPRLADHNEHLRRGGLGDESQGSRSLRDQRTKARRTLAGQSWTDELSQIAVVISYVVSKPSARATDRRSRAEQHINGDRT